MYCTLQKNKNRRFPTKQAYDELQQAYDFFNTDLFSGKLPNCLITIKRSKHYAGYFSAERFVNRDGVFTDEISLNPIYFVDRSIEGALSTLVHEMVHLWQKHFGKPGRGRYHNKEWAEMMESVGLMPSNTGVPGGKRTGDRMTHYVLEGGLFKKAHLKLVGGGFILSWCDRETLMPSNIKVLNDKNKSNRIKYTCSQCGINAWGKPGISLLCGDCNKPLAVVTRLSLLLKMLK